MQISTIGHNISLYKVRNPPCLKSLAPLIIPSITIAAATSGINAYTHRLTIPNICIKIIVNIVNTSSMIYSTIVAQSESVPCFIEKEKLC